jgi:hypothetical protein
LPTRKSTWRLADSGVSVVGSGVGARSTAKLDEGGFCRPAAHRLALLGDAGAKASGVEAKLSGDGLGRMARNERDGQGPKMLGKAAGAGAPRSPRIEGSAGVREISDGFGGHVMTSW